PLTRTGICVAWHAASAQLNGSQTSLPGSTVAVASTVFRRWRSFSRATPAGSYCAVDRHENPPTYCGHRVLSFHHDAPCRRALTSSESFEERTHTRCLTLEAEVSDASD